MANSNQVKIKNRRKDTRMALVLPARIQGHTGAGPWREMTSSDDASFGGCSFELKHPVELGHVLQVDIPIPKAFRRYGLSEPSYHTYALVRDIAPSRNGFRVGVMFLGKTPPKGFEHNPSGRYLLPQDPKPLPKERRQARRFDFFVNLRLRREDEGKGPGPAEETTVAENLGKGGARVMTSLTHTKGDVVYVEELGGSFRTRAEIKNVYIGTDNVPRLNLRFLDAEAPDRLIPAE